MLEINFIRPVAALGAAGTFWLADAITPEVPGVPAWATALGLPISFLIAVIYALVTINRSYRDSVAGRLADKDQMIAKLDSYHERDIESRTMLIRATEAQTRATEAQTVEQARMARLVESCPLGRKLS